MGRKRGGRLLRHDFRSYALHTSSTRLRRRHSGDAQVPTVGGVRPAHPDLTGHAASRLAERIQTPRGPSQGMAPAGTRGAVRASPSAGAEGAPTYGPLLARGACLERLIDESPAGMPRTIVDLRTRCASHGSVEVHTSRNRYDRRSIGVDEATFAALIAQVFLDRKHRSSCCWRVAR